VNDAPVANDDTDTTDEDTALVGATPGVLGNDTDVEGDSLTVSEVNGETADVGTEITLTSGALLTLNADGSYTYDPNGQFESLDDGESDTDSFTYTASDGDLGSNEATVTITITGVNDAPVISSASFGASVSCPTASGVTNATLSVSFTDIDDENPAFTATIDWDVNTLGPDEGPFPVAEGSFGRGHSYPAVGTYTARVTVSDGTTTDSKTTTVTVNYNTSGILQPVNWTQAHNDPSIFRWGSTIPVKVRFFNCDGTNAGSGLSVKVEVKKISGTTPPDGLNEAITNTNSPDSGGLMRWSGDPYIYNLNTGSLSDKSATYEITLTVQSTGQTVKTLFGTKAK
jgi:VCBS repeat-containing protein